MSAGWPGPHHLRWIECAELERDVAAHRERYTPWFAQLRTSA